MFTNPDSFIFLDASFQLCFGPNLGIGKGLLLILTLDNEAIGFTKKSWSALNLILLSCRFHIYKMKMSENRPSLALLKLNLKLYDTLDKYISITNDSTVSLLLMLWIFSVFVISSVEKNSYRPFSWCSNLEFLPFILMLPNRGWKNKTVWFLFAK